VFVVSVPVVDVLLVCFPYINWLYIVFVASVPVVDVLLVCFPNINWLYIMFVVSVPVVDVLLVCFPNINWLYIAFVASVPVVDVLLVCYRNTDNEHNIQPINIGKTNKQYEIFTYLLQMLFQEMTRISHTLLLEMMRLLLEPGL
jgi:uncharacterized membrane protein